MPQAQNPNFCSGIAVLPIVFIMGAIAVEIAVIGGILSFFGSSSNFSIKSGQEAHVTARAGIEDAAMRIARDKNFVTAAPYPVSIYSGSAITSASVFVFESGVNEKRVISTSTVFARTKTIVAIINVDDVTGKADIASIKETTSL